MKVLQYEEFYEEMWDYVSSKIVDDTYFFDHEPTMRDITKDIFDIYLNEEARIHPKYYGRLVESMFYHILRQKKTVKEIDYNRYEE